jgi:hypothetical protein
MTFMQRYSIGLLLVIVGLAVVLMATVSPVTTSVIEGLLPLLHNDPAKLSKWIEKGLFTVLAACRRDNRAGAVLSPQRAPSVFVRLTY